MPRQFIELLRKEIRHSFPPGLGHDRDHADRDRHGRSKKTSRVCPTKSASIYWRGTACRVAGVDIRIVDADGKEIALGRHHHGRAADPRPLDHQRILQRSTQRSGVPDGWFRTGDVATIDPEGYLQIMDRTKDLVKSGGEWISSVDLENAIMAHPKVMEAAVIAVFHPKWQERPLACVAPLPRAAAATITKQEILDFLAGRVAKWWLPDDIVFIDAVPKTSVGKFNKRALREQFKDYVLPGT